MTAIRRSFASATRTLGPDNWIYVTSGLTGGKIHRPGSTNVVTVKGDLRFRPDTWDFEPVDGKAQFGMSFDDDGHRFICMNRVHVQHVVLSSQYLHRNPAFPFSETVQNVPETMLSEPLPGHGTADSDFPISHNITTADSHAGKVHCGLRREPDLPRHRVIAGLLWQCLRLRSDRKPGPSRSIDPGGSNLRGASHQRETRDGRFHG